MLARLDNFFFSTLRRQLIVGVAFAIALLTIAFVTYLTHWQQGFLLQRQSELALGVGRTLAASSATWLVARDDAGLQELVDAKRNHTYLEFALVADSSKRIVAHTDHTLVGRYVDDLPDRPIEILLTQHRKLIDAAVPVMIGKQAVGWVRIGVGESGVEEKIAHIRQSGLLFALMAIFLTTIFSAWLGTRLTRRLGTLEEAMARLESGETGMQSTLSGTDEAARLAERFNRMQQALAERSRQRLEAEAELQRHRNHLEELVDLRTRELAEAKNAAEAANLAKSDFLANMSHEIRTPMNAVLGIAYLLSKTKLPGEANELVNKICIAGRSLQGIINDILDYSKIESGHLKLEQAPFCLGDVLDRVASVMSANVGSKEIELVIAPAPAGVDQLCGDALRLEQILVNLMGNAIKFTSRGHVQLTIDVMSNSIDNGIFNEIVNDTEDDKLVSLRFAVIDTGIGIALNQQHELFLPFTQADASTTRRFGGSGLGLAISRRLVALMGGEIGLTSIEGSGSEFWFTLRFERVASTRLSAPEMANLNILIADDNQIALASLSLTASGLGWRAQTAGSGSSAVEQVLAGEAIGSRNDVIILDWKMPGMDGLQAAHAIHDSLSDKHAPIILMVTAFSRDALLAAPGAELADDVLSKPVTASSLYNAVARARRVRLGQVAVAYDVTNLRLSGLRLLVVDDSDINREVSARIFAGEGAQVALACDGRQALDWLYEHVNEVDLVLMDVQMPVMDGYEATRAIRATPALAHLPVVALTAGAFREMQIAARDAGMDDYIAKPFNVEEAVAMIQRLTGLTHISADTSAEAGASTVSQNLVKLTPAPPPETVMDLPGLAVQRGLAVWRDNAVYKRYLRKFAHDYADCVSVIAQSEPGDGAAIAHKLKGAAGILALTGVTDAASTIDMALCSNTNEVGAPEVRAALLSLQDALAIALVSIADYAADDDLLPTESTASTAATATANSETPYLLKQVLQALNADDPSVVEPLLKELSSQLPPEQIAALMSAVDNFDFRSGEAATRRIAANLGVILEKV